MRELVEGDITAGEAKPFRLVKSMYKSCMNQKKIEEKGLAPLKSIPKDLGGWPLLEGDSWKQEGYKWCNMVYKFREEGIPLNNFVDVSVQPQRSATKTSSHRCHICNLIGF